MAAKKQMVFIVIFQIEHTISYK